MMLGPTQPLSVLRIVQPGGRASAPFRSISRGNCIDCRRGCRRHADGGDSARTGARIPEAAGVRRVRHAGFDAWRRVSASGRRCHGRGKQRQDRGDASRRARALARPRLDGRAGARRERQPLFDTQLFTLDPQKWGFDREGDFRARQTQLVAEAAAADGAQRTPARLNLARFYLARDLIPEAKGVLDVAASDEQAAAEGTPLLLRAIANVMMGRGADAMKDLAQASVASRTESVLWRALALAQQGKWSEAREGFRSHEFATATLPGELQRDALPRRCEPRSKCATTARRRRCSPNSTRSGPHRSAIPT